MKFEIQSYTIPLTMKRKYLFPRAYMRVTLEFEPSAFNVTVNVEEQHENLIIYGNYNIFMPFVAQLADIISLWEQY